jgi:hypothetical protein
MRIDEKFQRRRSKVMSRAVLRRDCGEDGGTGSTWLGTRRKDYGELVVMGFA